MARGHVEGLLRCCCRGCADFWEWNESIVKFLRRVGLGLNLGLGGLIQRREMARATTYSCNAILST